MSAPTSTGSNRDTSTKRKRRRNQPTKPDDEICTYFIRGRCTFGGNCKFIHQAPTTTDADANAGDLRQHPQNAVTAQTAHSGVGPTSDANSGSRQSHNLAAIHSTRDFRRQHSLPYRSLGSEKPASNVNEPMHIPKAKPCRQWNSVGLCNRGDKCRYNHDPQVQEAIRLRNDEVRAQKDAEERRVTQMAKAEAERKARISEQEAARKAHAAQQEAVRRAQQEQQEARRAKEEAEMTIRHIVLDSTIVTFSAGFAIQGILTGFECCRIRVKNLPSDAKYNEVCTLFTQQGIDPEQFHVVRMTKTPQGKQEADILCQNELKLVAVGLDGIDFRQEKLLFEIYQDSGVDGMRASTGSHSDVLTISWRAPSVGFVATYHDVAQAEAKVRELDRTICAGRRVKVEMNRQPPGQPLRHFSPNAITIKGLPSSITDALVTQFSGSALLRRLKPTEYDIAQALKCLRYQVEAVAQGQLKLFESVTTDGIDGTCTVRAHFDSWDQAKKIYDFLDKQRFWFIGNATFWLRLPDPLQYTINIPTQQYRAQKKRWDSLHEGIKDKEGCNLSVNARDKVYIRVGGEDKKAVGSLKVRVENLVAGEKLEHWHRSFGIPGGQRFLGTVFDETGTYIRNDWRLRALKAYGERTNVDAARIMVESEVKRLESLEQTVFLKRQSIGFFMRRGLAVLEEDLGKDNVALDISSSPCRITIKGGELARHTLSRFIEESLDHLNIEKEMKQDSKCPICYDEISSPVQLACGHSYCTACIRHFLTTASDTKKFPLTCMGDEDKCGIPIPIPMLQRFLLPQQFEHLLEMVFVTHIERFPQEFKYCRTPDCRQVYRCNRSSTSPVLHCPSCFSTVCSSCDEEPHEGMTCAERKLHNDPAEQDRLNDQLAIQSGFKKCPECKVWIEKTEGCNHMSCKCGAHICWVCMNVFQPGTIYNHMETAHGGMYGGVGNRNQLGVQAEVLGGADDAEDAYVVQMELLRVAGLRREQQQEDLRREEAIRRWRMQQENIRRQEEIRRQEVMRRQEQIRWQAEIRRQEARRQERAQKDNSWGCVIM